LRVGVRSSARSGSAALATHSCPCVTPAPWPQMPPHALRVPEYRRALRAGAVPKCRGGRHAVFPWRQGMLCGARIASVKFSLPERLRLSETPMKPDCSPVWQRSCSSTLLLSPQHHQTRVRRNLYLMTTRTVMYTKYRSRSSQNTVARGTATKSQMAPGVEGSSDRAGWSRDPALPILNLQRMGAIDHELQINRNQRANDPFYSRADHPESEPANLSRCTGERGETSYL
jgi:hypothetical protein